MQNTFFYKNFLIIGIHTIQLIIHQNRTIEGIGVCITHPYCRYRQYFAFCCQKPPKSTCSFSSSGSEVQSSPHCNGRSWLLLWKNTFAFLRGAGCALNCTHTLVRQCKSAAECILMYSGWSQLQGPPHRSSHGRNGGLPGLAPHSFLQGQYCPDINQFIPESYNSQKCRVCCQNCNISLSL